MPKNSKGKKTNPRDIPATQADVNRAKKAAYNQAIDICWAVIMNVMHDKYGFGKDRMKRLWGQIGKLSDEVTEGRVKVNDIKRTLLEECGISIEDAQNWS